MLIAAAWLFGAIAEDVVTGDRLTVLDVELAQWLRAHATPALTRWMLLVTDLHSTVAVVVLRRDRRRRARLAPALAPAVDGLRLRRRRPDAQRR